MKKIALLIAAVVYAMTMKAEDGSRLWLRYDKVQKACVTGVECIAAEELRNYYDGERVNLVVDTTMARSEERRVGKECL